ncbi:MAG: hypothetical protein NT154_20940 [Verrucomicrobia bacterium]|nr:hypothetical protein [Verrucomicrobiota bacterium]
MRRAHLSDDSLGLVHRRVVLMALLAWLPLLMLAALEGHLWGGTIAVPFLKDVEVHTRLLVVLPLLIIAEFAVHRRVRPLPQRFLERQLIPESAMPKFEAAIASAFRLRNSMVAELLLLGFVYGVGVLVIWRNYVTPDTATWYAMPSAGGPKPWWAGVWYGWVSMPLFQFLLCRWYFRLFIWARFLWQVSRIDLRLVPTHPDRAGGLGFLTEISIAFTTFAVAHGAMVAGPLAGRIFFLGASLPQFKGPIAVLVIILLCVLFGPLLVFMPQLIDSRRKGLREYGTLAQRYVREFDTKWLRGGAPAEEALVGSADIQSLADLGNSYEVVRSMNTILINKQAVLELAAATLLPLAPLLLTVMPLEDLLKQLASILF